VAKAISIEGRSLVISGTHVLREAAFGICHAGASTTQALIAAGFKAPVRPGDTLTTTWTIIDRLDKPKHHGGLVVLTCACENQTGTLVAEADGKILVASRKA